MKTKKWYNPDLRRRHEEGKRLVLEHGMNFRNAAKTVGCAESTFRRYMHDAGIFIQGANKTHLVISEGVPAMPIKEAEALGLIFRKEGTPDSAVLVRRAYAALHYDHYGRWPEAIEQDSAKLSLLIKKSEFRKRNGRKFTSGHDAMQYFLADTFRKRTRRFAEKPVQKRESQKQGRPFAYKVEEGETDTPEKQQAKPASNDQGIERIQLTRLASIVTNRSGNRFILIPYSAVEAEAARLKDAVKLNGDGQDVQDAEAGLVKKIARLFFGPAA